MQTTHVAMFPQVKTMLSIFQTYKEVSGLKLNESKSSIIPLEICTGMAKPSDISCKWLIPGEHEAILGIQVGSLYNDDISWNEMIKKFYRFLKQWIPKHITIFGRICAAKSYVASKSWYLASVIPPSPKLFLKSMQFYGISFKITLVWKKKLQTIATLQD